MPKRRQPKFHEYLPPAIIRKLSKEEQAKTIKACLESFLDLTPKREFPPGRNENGDGSLDNDTKQTQSLVREQGAKNENVAGHGAGAVADSQHQAPLDGCDMSPRNIQASEFEVGMLDPSDREARQSPQIQVPDSEAAQDMEGMETDGMFETQALPQATSPMDSGFADYDVFPALTMGGDHLVSEKLLSANGSKVQVPSQGGEDANLLKVQKYRLEEQLREMLSRQEAISKEIEATRLKIMIAEAEEATVAIDGELPGSDC